MNDDDDRFGLPLSLPEALRADPSHTAAMLAELIEETPAPPAGAKLKAQARPWLIAMAGLSMCSALGTPACAAAPQGLEGRWTMAPAHSSFREAVTGPAPDRVAMIVTCDDARRLAYELVESRRGLEVARGAYDVSFDGAPSTSSVGGAILPITASRERDGGIVLRAPQIEGAQASIHMRRTGPDTALLEHEVDSPDGVLRLETIALVRVSDTGMNR